MDIRSAHERRKTSRVHHDERRVRVASIEASVSGAALGRRRHPPGERPLCAQISDSFGSSRLRHLCILLSIYASQFKENRSVLFGEGKDSVRSMTRHLRESK
jgi:hypothetical protein